MPMPTVSALPGRALIHYLIAFVVMSLYGTQVCSFICTLHPSTWAGIVGAGLAAGFSVRAVLERVLLMRCPAETQSRWQYLMEFLTVVGVGVGIMLYDHGIYQFPLASGFKGIIGFATLGFFIAADMALAREYHTAIAHEVRGVVLNPEARYFSLPRKFSLFVIGCAVFVALVIGLLVSRDLEALADLGSPAGLQQAKQNVLQEIFIVLSILVAYLIALAVAYARNLRHFFGRQTETLQSITEGRLDTFVPVSTADEFGIIAKHTNLMIERLRERTERLEATQDATIIALAGLAETRDNETGMHIRRTQAYVKALAEHLKSRPGFAEALTEPAIALLQKSAPLHDVGKVGVPDAILLKPGRLTDEEFEEMKRHTVYGEEALALAERQLGKNSFLHLAREIAHTHHEKWDGSGYPRELSGTDIPVSGRLMALADVYDALISERCYKPAFSHEKARGILLEGKGTHFDPEVLDAFLAVEEEFVRIARELADA